MATLNRYTGIGRLTRDPEEQKFASGGKVAKFGFCVNERKKNSATGQWEDDPLWLDCEAFNWGNSNLADTILNYCRKGKQLYIEGRLKLDQWEVEGQKRSKMKVVVTNVIFIGPKEEGEGGSRPPQQQRSAPPSSRRSSAPPSGGYGYGGEDEYSPPSRPPMGTEEDIPF